jgi:hypothetical protein
MDTEQAQNLETNNNTNNTIDIRNQEANPENEEAIMDLPKLAVKSDITNSDIILAIFEICTFNKKYNYECSNNTKSFWDRVVQEGILKNIFKNFKSETLRKYWKIIRQTGNNAKFMEIVRQNETFINNPFFKLLPIINGISAYISSPPEDKKTFQEYFLSVNIPKEKKVVPKEENNAEKEKKEKKLKEKKEEQEESEKEFVEPKLLEMNNTLDILMKLTKCTREEAFSALLGCTGNIKNAYLYLMDNDKYEKYFFYHTDDYVIKHLKNKHYYTTLLNKKGEDNVNEREKFIKKLNHIV